jgi:hypothetical protein
MSMDRTTDVPEGERDRECAAMEARVLGGERPHEDAALAAHLGSCLRCFRAASELRDLPRLEGLLRSTPPEGDPGEAFWNSFPARVADAWQASQVLAPAVPAASLWGRWLGWLRLPVPAALAGAACAGALVFALGHGRPDGHAPAVAPPVGEEAPVVAVDEALLDREEDVGEDFVHSLDASGLELLLEAHGPATAAAAPASAAAEETDEDDLPAAEELDLLDEGDLKAVSEKLGRNI